MNLREQMAKFEQRLRAAAAKLERPIQIMEVCGTHTVNACRSGVHSLMPDNVELVSGPGCPVCVTAQRHIDAMIELASKPGVILATYGDMLRVTGSTGSLEMARSTGADVRVVQSSMEAVAFAQAEPNREVVFAAVGFETTAPATAAAILAAQAKELTNFSAFVCHKLVMPAMRALLDDPETSIDGFLCPGHVSVILGSEIYRPIVEEYGRPSAISGFEALQIMEGLATITEQITSGEARLDNLYLEVVTGGGNPHAQALVAKVFEPGSAVWRSLGEIPESGLDLREEFTTFDATKRFALEIGEDHEPPGCICGKIITGRAGPMDCGLFSKICTPVFPVGPCMVSSEGSCHAWFRYRRFDAPRDQSPPPVKEEGECVR